MSDLVVQQPTPSEYAPPFGKYVTRVDEPDVMSLLAGQLAEVRSVLSGVRGEAEHFRYAEGKWSVREVVGHLVDTERIMGYRAVCVARGEAGSLPGFDENAYVAHASFDDCPLGDLLDEWEHVRASHLAFFRHLAPTAFARLGQANGHPI